MQAINWGSDEAHAPSRHFLHSALLPTSTRILRWRGGRNICDIPVTNWV
jgi:hypothetical protein